MQYRKIRLPIRTEGGDSKAIKFEGSPLGRSTGRKIGCRLYTHATEIYRVKGGGFLLYVFRRDGGGELQLADFARADELDFAAVRTALKEANLYPGPGFSEALYHSYGVLDLLDEFSD